MPWETFSHMSDDELKAIYKFLKTVKPIHNQVFNYTSKRGLIIIKKSVASRGRIQ